MTYPPRPIATTAPPITALVSTPLGEGPASEPDTGSGTTRFAQLTYSSFDDGSSLGGGWQVKDVVGGLTDAEVESLRYWVNTTFEVVTPLPQFPTPEEVLNFPRRLMYTGLDEQRAGYWHTAPAGADGSGRPGNVFAHTVMDRYVEQATPAFRPIDLWRSSDWLTPYGAGDVALATLDGSRPPGPGAMVGRSSIVRFLCDPDEWRMGTLGVLLDAVAAALDGGPKVVLGTDSADQAALWIGGVSHLMSAGTARRFHWSTYDRSADVSVSIGRGVHLVAVPAADLGSIVPSDDLVILSDHESPAMGDLGGAPHLTAAGSTVTVTEWSVIAQGLLIDLDTAEATLGVQDSIAETLRDNGLHPAWPVAMAVALTPALHQDLGDEAASVIARHSPDQLSTRPELVGPAADLIDRKVGTTAGDCWHRLEGVRPSRSGHYSVAVELILTVYIERALRDREWLMQPGGVPFLRERPRRDWVPGKVADQIAETLAGLVDRTRGQGSPSPEFAFEVLRTVDLLVRAACIGDGSIAEEGARSTGATSPPALRTPAGLRLCEEAIGTAVVPILFDPGAGPQFVAYFGPVDPATASLLLQPALARADAMHQGTLGNRLVDVVLDWVLPRSPRPPATQLLLESPPGSPLPTHVLLAELAYQRITHPAATTVKEWSGHNFLILWRVFEQSQNPRVRPPALEPVFAAKIDVAGVAALARRHGSLIPSRYFARMLATEPMTDALRFLASNAELYRPPLEQRPLGDADVTDELGVALAAMRLRTEWPAMTAPERTALQGKFLRPSLRIVTKYPVSGLPSDLVNTLAVIGLAETIAHPEKVDAFDYVKVVVRAAHTADRKGLVDAVAALTRPEHLRVTWIVESAIIGADGAPDARLSSASERFMCSLTREVDDRPVSLLDAVIDVLVDNGSYGGPADPEAVEELLRPRVTKAHPKNGDKILSQYRKFAKKWLDDRGLGAGGIMSRLRRK